MFRAIGMGLAMMPIMTGGISAVPPDQVTGASAFNNVTQRTAAAMGLAALTALLGSRQAQQLSDTGAVMGMTSGGTSGAGVAAAASGSSAPGASGGMSPLLDHYMMYTQAQASAFTTALDNLMIVTSVLTGVGVVLACFLRNGPAPKTGEPAVVEV
jgi:hypothetical protein